jgi:hypothetical protein
MVLLFPNAKRFSYSIQNKVRSERGVATDYNARWILRNVADLDKEEREELLFFVQKNRYHKEAR